MKGRILILFGMVLACFSCVNDELCIGEGTNTIKLSFFEYEVNPDTPVSITFDSIEVSGNPENYPSFEDTTASVISLSSDPERLRTGFIFYAKNEIDTTAAGRIDTLVVTYERTSRLISPTCGPEFIFSGLETISYSFDSLELVETNFSRDIETNIKIYY
ncbi:MAG: DUF6452 family protein [Bacteroidetes bacterium]|nr:DUF6452 family protein [Bacteroidota bacterium]